MFHGSDIANRVVSALPEEEFRPGFDLALEGPDGEVLDEQLQKDLMADLARLRAWPAMLDGRIWGRLYGGAATVLGADDGQGAAEPLDVARVKRLDWLVSIDRRELVPNRRYTDGPKAGQVETYWLVPSNTYETYGAVVAKGSYEIHETRLIVWPGVRTARREKQLNFTWDHSVLDTVWPVIKSFETTWRGSELLSVEASQGVFKIRGLAEKLLKRGGAEAMATRFSIVDQAKSTMNSIVLDADQESYDRQAVAFAGLPDLLKEARLRLSAAVQIPVVILFGQQVGGLGQEGSTDLRWFFDRTKVSQVDVVQPRLVRLLEILLLLRGRQGIRPVIKWRSLWEPTAVEVATERQAVATTDAQYIRDGVFLAEEIALSRIINGQWSPGYSAVDTAARRAVLVRALAELADPPDPPDVEGTRGAYPPVVEDEANGPVT
jgi:phage-related protein (TIGR01555 family)